MNYRKQIKIKQITSDPYQFRAYRKTGNQESIGETEPDRVTCFENAKKILIAEDKEEARKAGYTI